MKKLVFLFTIILLGTTGCDQIDKFTQFDLEYNETITIPATWGMDVPFDVYTPKIESNSDAAFSVNNTKKNLVEEVELTSLTLSIKSPENSDFSFLSAIEIYLYTDSLPEIKVAWKEDIPNDAGKVLNLETADTDLKEYIKADEFKLRINTVTDELITSEHEIDILANFFVDAKILGI